MPSITPVDSGATLTDSLTGWGTIALAVVTFFTVLVTIHIANTDRRRDDKLREQEKRHRQKAQARLVIVEAPSPGLSLGEDENRYGLYFTIANHSQQPVMGVEAEVWMGAATLDQPCTSRGKLEDYVVMPLGHNNKLKVIVESPVPEPSLGAWRVRWTDADGVEWHVDAQHPEPQTGTAEPTSRGLWARVGRAIRRRPRGGQRRPLSE
jgi:hypothetical protein